MEPENDAEFFAHKDQTIIPNVKGRIKDGKTEMNNTQFIDYSEHERIVTIRVADKNVPDFWCDIPICLNQLENYIDSKRKNYGKRQRSNAMGEIELPDLAWF
jgi:hypothetical protein